MLSHFIRKKTNSRKPMKPYLIIKTLGSGLIALGLFASPPALAQDDVKIKIKDNKVKIKGEGAVEAAREILAPEVTSTFVEGYTVPTEELPPLESNDVVIRYHAGRAYYVDSDSWKIVRVVNVNPALQAEANAAFVEGYVIPEAQRTTFVEVPRPEENITVRYYNDTVYYMDPNYRIVRTVRLGR